MRTIPLEWLVEEKANRLHGECSCVGHGRDQGFDCPWHLYFYEELDRMTEEAAEREANEFKDRKYEEEGE